MSSCNIDLSGQVAQSNSDYRASCGPIEIRAANEADNEGCWPSLGLRPWPGIYRFGSTVIPISSHCSGFEEMGKFSWRYESGNSSVAFLQRCELHTSREFRECRIYRRHEGASSVFRNSYRAPADPTLEAHLRSVGIDLCFSVVADGNQRVMPLFEGRWAYPDGLPLDGFSLTS